MHVLVWLSSLLCVVAFVVLEDLFSDPAAPILKEMREIDDELASLAPARLTPAVPTLGYLSDYWRLRGLKCKFAKLLY